MHPADWYAEAVLGGLLACTVSVAASPPDPAAQKPASYELEWSAPEACPAAESIRERIAELVPAYEGGDGVMYVNVVVSRPDRPAIVETARHGMAGGRTLPWS